MRLDKDKYLGASDGKAFLFQVTGRDATGDQASQTKEEFNKWDDKAFDLGQFKVIPFGSGNNILNEIQEAVFPNHLAPRILARKAELLFGQGPYLYKQVKDGRQYYREPMEDKKIQDWLESFDYENLLIHNATEYYYAEQVAVRVRSLKGGRVGDAGALASLEQLSMINCRLAYLKTALKKTPTHVIVGDWTDTSKKDEFQYYPLFDPLNPAKAPFTVHFSGLRSFGLSNYVLPSTYGTINWIKRSTTAPKVIEAHTENGLNVRYHITSPQKYWDDMREELKKKCRDDDKTYKEKMLHDVEDEIFQSLTEVLSGIENVGKFWHSKTVTELIGGQPTELGWKITPIKQEVKEYVEAQIKVADKSDFAVQAGLGLHASLANVGADGKSDSGSEQLYARTNHEQTGLPIPEFYVTKALNDALKAKFKTDLRIGFYHIAPDRMQDVTSSQRVTNTAT